MATLYDANGNPVDFRLLKRELAAPSLTSVRQIVAEHPSTGLTPEKLGRLLRVSEHGDPLAYLALAQDMEEKDLNYRAQLQTRKLACAGLPLVVEAASDSAEDQADADLVREVTSQEGVEDILTDILDALGKGFSVCEILWDTQGKLWIPKGIPWRDPRWFLFSLDDGWTVLLRDVGLPQPLAPYKFIVHRPKLKSGIPIRGGLARASAWSYLFGSYVLKDWVGFCELFGQPIRVGKYPDGIDEDKIEILRRAVRELGTDAAAIIPEGMLIEFVQAASKGESSGLYENLMRFLEERVTLAVLGQTLTSGQTRGGGGSMALGQVHNMVRLDLLKADARQLAFTLNRDLVRPLIDLNRGPRQRYPKLRVHVEEPEDLALLADSLAKLVPLGLKVEQSVVRDRFGFPDPPEGKDVELLGVPPAPEPAPSGGGNGAPKGTQTQAPKASQAQRHCPHCAAHAQGVESDPADRITDQLESEAQDSLARLMEPVRRMVMHATSLEEIRDGLLDLYPAMDNAGFAELFTDAMTAAAMAGRFEVSRGR
jgi:phage gp29-like protein